MLYYKTNLPDLFYKKRNYTTFESKLWKKKCGSEEYSLVLNIEYENKI